MLAGENGVGALYNYKIQNKRENFSANTFAKINFTDYLSFKTQYSYSKYTFDSYQYSSNEFGNAANVNGRVAQNRDFTITKTFTNSLNFNKTFEDIHNISVDLIQEAYSNKYDALSAQGTGFLPNVEVINGSTTPESIGGYTSESRLSSYLGRAAYNYDRKYFIEGSYRTDGSSQFGSDVRWGGFYAFGGSWILTKEAFLEDVNFLSNLKLRASYGELGNNNVGDFPYLLLYPTGWNELGNTGVILGDIADPILTWEKSAQTNIGVDFSLFNNRLSGSVDWYNKEAIDLIMVDPVAMSTGNNGITRNVGALSNKGWELSLNSTNITTDNVLWTTSFNLANNKQEVTKLTQDNIIAGTKRYEVGRSTYDFWIRDYAGVDENTGSALWYVYEMDAEGNQTGNRTTTDDYAIATRVYQDKTSLPTVVGGLTNFVRVGNWDLNVLFNYAFGAYVYDSTYAGLMGGYNRAGNSTSPDLEDRWQNQGDICLLYTSPSPRD